METLKAPFLVNPSTTTVVLPRKRRRQLYFVKRAFKGAKPKRQPKKTKDSGKFEQPPPTARRQIFIEEKLKVVRFYNNLVAERQKAQKVLQEPTHSYMTAEDKQQQRDAKAKAKQILRRNLQEECKKEFKSLVGNTQVCRWVQTAKHEAWESMPASQRARSVTTTNDWRRTQGLAPRGRKTGGQVPLELQRELDYLVMAHVRGNSEVTERSEVVSIEHIAARPYLKAMLVQIRVFFGRAWFWMCSVATNIAATTWHSTPFFVLRGQNRWRNTIGEQHVFPGMDCHAHDPRKSQQKVPSSI